MPSHGSSKLGSSSGSSSINSDNNAASSNFLEGLEGPRWDPDTYTPLRLFVDATTATSPNADAGLPIPWVSVQPQFDRLNAYTNRVLRGVLRFPERRSVGKAYLRDVGKVFESDENANSEVRCRFFVEDDVSGDVDTNGGIYNGDGAGRGSDYTMVGPTFDIGAEVEVNEQVDGCKCLSWIGMSLAEREALSY